MPAATTALAACLVIASHTYSVPVPVMLGILQVEGGRVGLEMRNRNGTHDLGPMQINTIWMPELARHWKTDVRTVRRWVRDDGCTNIHVGAWILRRKIHEAGNLSGGIARYHSGTPHLGRKYLGKVTRAMQRLGLLASNQTGRTRSRRG
ncbi:MAG: lytic transglycosylase domain-containing protein [Pseudomonadota bacterium]|nr:lytic transglycosylase domain-containing protein [Pseudomonadota bacterium]